MGKAHCQPEQFRPSLGLYRLTRQESGMSEGLLYFLLATAVAIVITAVEQKAWNARGAEPSRDLTAAQNTC